MSETLVLLVLLWAVLLVPSALRNRTNSPHVTVGGFERAMDVLRTPNRSGTGRQLLVPGEGAGRIVSHSQVETEAPRPYHPEDPVVAARRLTFTRLLAASGVAILVAIIVGGLVWWAAIAALAVTTGYASLLRRWKVQRDEMRAVVREIEVPRQRAANVPAPTPSRVPVGAVASPEEAAAPGAIRLRHWDS